MTLRSWIEAPIAKQHDRESFDCGEADLNLWFARYARQSHASGGAKTFVAIEPGRPHVVLGFYSISPASLEYARAPSVARRGLGRYEVPLFRLGRLAVDRSFHGRGVGGGLLLAAVERCFAVAAEVGGVGLIIDAKSERAAAWYEGYGAIRLSDAPQSLVLPFSSVLGHGSPSS